jgi:hypothetical protein
MKEFFRLSLENILKFGGGPVIIDEVAVAIDEGVEEVVKVLERIHLI